MVFFLPDMKQSAGVILSSGLIFGCLFALSGRKLGTTALLGGHVTAS